MPAPNTIDSSQLARLIGTPDCPVLIDICIDADFAEDPRLIPTSVRHPFGEVETLVPELQRRSCVVICQKGKKLSQGAAALLRTHGINAEVLRGGVQGWRDAGGVLIPAAKLPPRGALWVTRHRPKIDRIACPWLIRRFIDPQARFLYVSPSEVLDVSEKFGAIPFDVEGAEIAHGDGTCSFDAVIARFGLALPALETIARVIRAADGVVRVDAPEAQGLLAMSLGLSRMYAKIWRKWRRPCRSTMRSTDGRATRSTRFMSTRIPNDAVRRAVQNIRQDRLPVFWRPCCADRAYA